MAVNDYKIWNLDKAELPEVTIGDTTGNYIKSLARSPDGRWLVSAAYSNQNNLRLWTETGAAGPKLNGHDFYVNAIDWNRFNGHLASLSLDGKLCLWHVTGDVSSPKVNLAWIGLILPDDQAAVFSEAGELLCATPQAESRLVYYAEPPDGQLELFTPAEFKARLNAN